MTKLGFGMMRLPLKDPDDKTSIDFDLLDRMVDRYLGSGNDYFDTAYMYHGGTSESALRRSVVERHPRDSFRIATKMPLMSLKEEGDQERIFGEQLANCGVDFFDSYLLHNVCGEFIDTVERFGTFDFLRSKRKEGRIRRLGFSFHDQADLLDRVLTENPDMDFVQLQVNYIDWDDPSIQSKECCEVARRHGVPIVVMEPVKGGLLADVPEDVRRMYSEVEPSFSPATWAIRFAASVDGVETVLSGMSDMAQLEENIACLEGFTGFDDVHMDAMERAKTSIRSSVAVPCTACRYCMKSCPNDIPIADYISLYNAEKANPKEGFSLQALYYGNISRNHGRASDCVGCGECERNCPQHLRISGIMEDVAELFENRGRKD